MMSRSRSASGKPATLYRLAAARRITERCALVASALGAALFGTGATSNDSDAITLFDRARAIVAARPIPAFVAYTEYAAILRHGKIRAQHERVIVRMSDGKANVTPIPDSAADRIDTHPYVKDRPLVCPTTTFGLIKGHRGELPAGDEALSTPQPAPGDGGLRTIGSVVSNRRDYDVALVGRESLAGVDVYHLKLTPRFDPKHHPIRDLYLDATTDEPRRISIIVNAQAGPIRSRPTVDVDFMPVGTTWVIDHATMDFVLTFGFIRYGGSGEYRIRDVTFPTTEPNWMFDAKSLAEHLASPAP